MLDFSKNPDGLVAAVAQDWQTGEVLMLAWMNQAAWEATLATGRATYWSRSRGKLWCKGETSGQIQIIHDILVDCDQDAVLLKIEQVGDAACHTGRRSCFSWRLQDGEFVSIAEPLIDPDKLYGK